MMDVMMERSLLMVVMIERIDDGCHDRYPNIQYTLEVREEECRDSRTRSISCTDCYLSEEREQNNSRDWFTLRLTVQ